METRKLKPKVDKLFLIMFIITAVLIIAVVVIPTVFNAHSLFITLPIALFVLYFLISPLFGYVELREDEVLIKYGFFLKRRIPYEKLRSAEKERKFYSESMLSLKNAFEHVNIKYNRFDVTTVSVEDNDALIAELDKRKRAIHTR